MCTNFDTYETQLDVNEALNKLSTQLKTVIVLYYYNEMTIKQIAKVLGCFEGTVKSRLHNARKFLQKVLEDGSLENAQSFFIKERRAE